MWKFLGLCWRDLWRNRRRTLLAGVVMMFSVAVMILFIGLGDGAHLQMIHSATDASLGHIQIQERGYQEEPDLEHLIGGEELEALMTLIPPVDGVRAIALRMNSGGLMSKKTPPPLDPDDDNAYRDAAAEGAFIIGVDPVREKQVSTLQQSLVPDDPHARCLRGCEAALAEVYALDRSICADLCDNHRESFESGACESSCDYACSGSCQDSPAEGADSEDDELDRLLSEDFEGLDLDEEDELEALLNEDFPEMAEFGAAGESQENPRSCEASCRDRCVSYCEPPRFLAEIDPFSDNKARGEVLLGAGLAGVLNVDVGDEVAMNMGTATGSSAGVIYRVAGLLKTGSLEINRMFSLTHLASLARRLDAKDSASAVLVRVDDVEKADRVAAEINRVMGGALPGLRALSWEQLSPELDLFVKIDQGSLLVTLAFMIMIVGVILANVVTMSVMERTREYGVRLAIGESPRRIAWGLIIETTLLALLAGTLGAVIGEAFNYHFQLHGLDMGMGEIEAGGVIIDTRYHSQITVYGLVFSMGTVLLFSVVGALYPAWRIRRLKPVEALRFV